MAIESTTSETISGETTPDANAILQDQPEDTVELSPGTDLSTEAAASITASGLTRLVLVAGEADSGKTTLLATIYEKFNEGQFADFLFAGSKTLVGWERRCHLSRIASGASKADTERTLGLNKRLLHLRIRQSDREYPAQDLLFTDLSGEVFKLVRDSSSECQQLSMLKRADHIVVLLDGRKLISTTERHDALTNAVSLVRSCIDEGMIGRRSFLDIAFSKFDIIASAKQMEFVEHSISAFRRYEPRVGRLRFHQIAARPESAGFEYAYGISDLLRSWIDDTPYIGPVVSQPLELPPSSSEFDKFLRTMNA